MLEHIFRNITDIRVFDLFFCNHPDGNNIEIDDVMDELGYPDYMEIQIQDSLDHLVRQKVLEIVKEPAESWTGCKLCRLLDKIHIPRLFGHKTHHPHEIINMEIDTYRIYDNELTRTLFLALFHHIGILFELHNQDESKER